MLIEVKVPQLSESVSEATLVTWHKKEGDAVARDENLIDIETDKVVLETPAPADGVLVKIIKQGGDTVTSGELIAQIDTEAKGRRRRRGSGRSPGCGRTRRRCGGVRCRRRRQPGRAQDPRREGHRRRRRRRLRPWRSRDQGRCRRRPAQGRRSRGVRRGAAHRRPS
jgi:pyruvate/2-oxoglutarate dehydrogenase complex dihydrolipoamide acyltransferase (E2) component